MTDVTDGVGKLKQAAIDAAMRERDYIVEGGSYVYRPMGVQGVPGEVTRPGTDGSDGGVVLHVSGEHPRAGMPQHLIDAEKQRLTEILAEEFEQIRHSIDSIVAPWQAVPSAAGVTAVSHRTSCPEPRRPCGRSSPTRAR